MTMFQIMDVKNHNLSRPGKTKMKLELNNLNHV